MSMIYDSYMNYTRELKKEYGERSIVFLHVGSFIEVYGKKDKITNEISGSEIVDFKNICEFSMKEKSGAKTSDGYNIVMAGFPDYNLDKYTDKLVEHQYTVAVYMQEKQEKNTNRHLHVIASPGTHMSSNNVNCISNYIMCIKVKVTKESVLHAKRIIIGVSTLDIINGDCNVCEYVEDYSRKSKAYDSLERYFTTYKPAELIVLYDPQEYEKDELEYVLQSLHAKNIKFHILYNNDSNHLSQYIVKSEKQKYQEDCISMFYHTEEVHAFLDKHRLDDIRMALSSFVFLLNFVHMHDKDMVYRIKEPCLDHEKDHMVLANHSLLQLNIINNNQHKGKYSSVINVLDNTKTNMGKRLFRHRLLHPTTDKEWLDTEYDKIENISNTSSSFQQSIRQELSKICDLSKMYRKIVLKKCTTDNIDEIHTSLDVLLECIQMIEHEQCYGSLDELTTNIHTIKSYLESIFCFDDENRLFLRGIYPEIDAIEDQKMESEKKWDTLISYFDKVMKEEEFKATKAKKRGSKTAKMSSKIAEVHYCKVHQTEKSGKYMKCTKKRGDGLIKLMKNYNKNNEKVVLKYVLSKKKKEFPLDTDITLTTGVGNEKKIFSKQLEDLSRYIMIYEDKYNTLLKTTFLEILENIRNMFFNTFRCISDIVADIDILFTNAYNVKQYHLCKPEIDKTEDKSYFDAKDIRHILIEQLQQNELYVTNDWNTRYDDRGMLLFGTNAVGKSSFIKSIGICLIMAQAGCYVPCSEYTYVPYNQIFTRILGNDNIFKGLSTFAVEITELDIIVRHADENSLVLGDELCSGTEMGSAVSIFAAGLKALDKVGSSFIFATHFHEIITLEDITHLSLKHMKVVYDQEKQMLIYDRKLSDGAGNNRYGLEVAKSMHLPASFIEDAYDIRSRLYDDKQSLSKMKESRYNAKKIIHECEMCGEKADHVHHLQHQSRSDEDGFINNFHKNHKANLISICESCHYRFHEENRQYRRTKTSEGYILREE